MLSVVVWLALIVWLGLVIWALSVVRAAAVADAPSPSPERLAAGRVPYAGRRRAMAVTQGVLLVAVLALAARRREFARVGELAAVVALAILANAAVCGALSNPNDRYGARMVWLATLVVLLVPWMRRQTHGHARFA